MEKNKIKNVVRIAWGIFAIALIILLGLEPVIHRHTEFGMDGKTLFSAWYGVASGVFLIFLTKLVGWFLKRPADFYNDRRKS